MTRRKIVAGNWKMNGSSESVVELVKGLKSNDAVDVVIAPAFVYLPVVSDVLKGSEIKLAAQTVSEFASGAYTGEVSLAMLKDFSVSHVILGHSERRSLFLETDAQVAKKVLATLEAGLTPILCVGETLEQREAGTTLDVCNAQVDAVLELVGVEMFDKVVVAYEPVWAIGSGLVPSEKDLSDIFSNIRKSINKLDSSYKSIKILYGGSVSPENASSLMNTNHMDGLLIGGASLNAKKFIDICLTI